MAASQDPSSRIRPPRLTPGDTLGVVAPASPLFNRSDIARAVSVLEAMGLRVKLGSQVREQHGYLAGTDSQRASDFMTIWMDPEVQGVLCLRGGYGSARIADQLDYDAIRRNPKPFIGFSDITALHLALGKQANLVTFYGPMIVSLSRLGGDPPGRAGSETRAGFLRALTSPYPLGVIGPRPDDAYVETMNHGTAEGEFVGGCLKLLVASIGTRDDFDWRGKIVFLEDVNEEPATIDAGINQLLRAGKFRGVAGIVLSEFAGCEPRAFRPAFPSSLSVEDIFDELIRPLGVPTIFNLPLGHGAHLATLPLGVRARLDATARVLEILDRSTAN